jgi:hypothetical protein
MAAGVAVSCCRVFVGIVGGSGGGGGGGGADMKLCRGAGDGFARIHCHGYEEVVVDWLG